MTGIPSTNERIRIEATGIIKDPNPTMLVFFAAFLVVLYALGTRSRAPLRVLALAWFISVAPILAGLIEYDYFPNDDWALPLMLIGFLSCFVLGALLSELNSTRVQLLPRCSPANGFAANSRLPSPSRDFVG